MNPQTAFDRIAADLVGMDVGPLERLWLGHLPNSARCRPDGSDATVRLEIR
jgi:hypothetical protein